jgi:hypothetical protein
MGTANLFSHHAADHAQAAGVTVPTATRPVSFLPAAMACLGVAYALSWLELALSVMVGAGSTSAPVAAMAASRVLLGGLYLCVALRLQWARWLTVALGLVSVIVVGPMLGAEWSAYPVAAVVTGATLVCKLAASLFLISLTASSQSK